MSKNSPVFLLTTTDNPYNPFTEWKSWYLWDLRHGYDTCGLIARTASDGLEIRSGAELDAMRSIVELNFSGKHVMITNEEFDSVIKTPQTKT